MRRIRRCSLVSLAVSLQAWALVVAPLDVAVTGRSLGGFGDPGELDGAHLRIVYPRSASGTTASSQVRLGIAISLLDAFKLAVEIRDPPASCRTRPSLPE